jgi:hypothetical protein
VAFTLNSSPDSKICSAKNEVQPGFRNLKRFGLYETECSIPQQEQKLVAGQQQHREIAGYTEELNRWNQPMP